MLANNRSKHVTQITKFGLLGLGGWLFISSFAVAHLSGSLSVDAITQRMRPIGKVNISGVQAPVAGAASGGPLTPEQIYTNNCKMCHEGGLLGAPKFGNKGDWAPRIAQGMETLYKNSWNGIRAMPPRGNCLKCTEDDIKATVDYMVNSAK